MFSYLNGEFMKFFTNFVKNIAKVLIVAAFARNSFAMKIEDSNKNMKIEDYKKENQQVAPYVNNVIELLDSGAEESFYASGGGFLINYFNASLDQKSASIVISGVILHSWLKYLQYFEQKMEKSLKEKSTFLNFCSSMRTKYFETTHFSEEQLNKNKKDRLEYFSNTENNNDLKEVLKNETKNSEYLSLPAEYYFKNKDFFIKNKDDFDFSDLNKTYNVDQYGYCNDKKLIRSYQSFLRKDKLASCHIYYNKQADVFLFVPNTVDTKKISDFFAVDNSSVLKEITVKDIPGLVKSWDSLSWKVKMLYQELNGRVKWNELKKIYKPTSKDWIFFHCGHGWQTNPLVYKKPLFKDRLSTADVNKASDAKISGLYMPDALARLKFLGTDIKTLSTTEITCFGAGRHAAMVGEHLSILEEDKNFERYTYISGAFTNAVTYGPQWPEVINLDEFFKEVRMSSTNKASLNNAWEHIKTEFCSEFTDLNGIAGLPLVRLPGKKFTPLRKKLVFKLGKKDSDNELFVINKKVIVLTKPDVKNTLNIMRLEDYAPTICSLIADEVVHEIKGITATFKIEQLLRDLFFSIREPSEKVFIIRSLCVTDSNHNGMLTKENNVINLENVIVRKGYSIKGNGLFDDAIKMVGEVYCKIKDKNSYFKAVLADNSDNFVGVATLQDFTSISEKTFKNMLEKTESLILKK
jgi:hypothetical protein